MRRDELFKVGARAVGKLRADGVYISFRDKRHFFRIFKGFGISTATLMSLRKKGCKKIVIVYKKDDGTQSIYTTYSNKFLEAGKVYRDGKHDYQRILPLEEFNK